MNHADLLEEPCDEATTVLCLNRPQRRNALTIELMENLCCRLDELAADHRCRALILRGAGPVVGAGLDLHQTAETQVAEQAVEVLARMFQKLVHSPLVTIAAAHGGAYAGGAGLMAACDLAVAASDLHVGFPEVRRGLVAAVVAAVLRDKLQDGALRELLLLAEPVNASRALSLGLVQRVVPREELLPESKRIAATILKGAPDAIRQTKHWLREIRSITPSHVMTRALKLHHRARVSEEAAEGIAAWRERRQPSWSVKDEGQRTKDEGDSGAT